MYKLPNSAEIDMDSLISAMSDKDKTHCYFLNLKTGQVTLLAKIDYRPESFIQKLSVYKKNPDLVNIPYLPLSEHKKILEDFIETIISFKSPDFSKKLLTALKGKNGYDKCFQILEDDKDREGWIYGWDQWKNDRIWEIAGDWFATLPVEITDEWEYFDDCPICQAMKNGASGEELIEVMKKVGHKTQEKINKMN